MHLKKILLVAVIAYLFGLSSVFGQPQPCGNDPQMTSTCAEACVICDIDGFSGINDLTAMGQGFDGFCTTQYNNMQYLAFVAGSTSLTIVVDVGQCTGGVNSLEVGFFESLDCENFSPITPCDTEIPSNTSQQFITQVPLTIGQYYYLVIDGSGGANCTWTFNVTEGSTQGSIIPSSGEITPPLGICPELPAEFSTTEQFGASNYEWRIDGVLQSNSLSNSAMLNFPGDGTFEVCVTASNVCSEGPPTCITVEAYTPGDSFFEEEVCDGDCLIINGIEYCETGSYTDFILFDSGCDSTINIDLIVLETPMESITALICNDTVFQVGSSSFNTDGVYEVTVLTANQCDSVVTLNLSVIECEIFITPEEIPVICNGTATGTLVFSVDQGEPPLTWTYTNLTDPTITGTGMTNLLINNEIPNIPVGIYNVYVSDNFGNDAVVIQEVTEPALLTSNMNPSIINGFNLSCAESSGMPGKDGSLMVDVNGGVASYSYEWSDGQIGPSAVGLFAETYIVTITDDVGCTMVNSFTLNAPPPIDAQIDFIDPNCDGLETGIVQINTITGGTPTYQYSLNNSSFQALDLFDGLSEGVYEFTIIDENGCLLSEQSEIFAPEIPEILTLEDLTVALGCEVIISPELNISEFNNITWVDASTLDCDNCLTPSAGPFNTSTYTLSVTSVDDCTTVGSLRVFVEKDREVYIPNVFSPNDDGINDRFTVHAGKQVEMISSLRVYNRWGELVFDQENLQPNDTDQGWNGRFKDRKAINGIYSYIAVIEYLDGESIPVTGDVLILR